MTGRGPAGARVVVVTGASSGIGRAVALQLAERGDTVVLAARGEQGLTEVAQLCRERGGVATVVPTDVSDDAAVTALVERAVAEHGRIDAFVSAAAVWSYGRFEDTPADVFRQVVDTTLMGQVACARAVLPQLRRQGHGVLVSVASLYSRVTSPYVSPYVTAKWGLLGLMRVLRQELRDAPDIHVCTVLPGATDTPVYRHAAHYVGHEIRPLPPVVAPERVARAVLGQIDRPRPQVVVGRTQHLGVLVHAGLPRLWDAVVGPVVDVAALRRAPGGPDDGTVFETGAGTDTVDDGWRRHDRAAVARAVRDVAAGRIGPLVRRLRAQASRPHAPRRAGEGEPTG